MPTGAGDGTVHSDIDGALSRHYESELEAVIDRVGRLRSATGTRSMVEQAVCVLMVRLKIGRADAVRTLARLSRRGGLSLVEAAHLVVAVGRCQDPEEADVRPDL